MQEKLHLQSRLASETVHLRLPRVSTSNSTLLSPDPHTRAHRLVHEQARSVCSVRFAVFIEMQRSKLPEMS